MGNEDPCQSQVMSGSVTESDGGKLITNVSTLWALLKEKGLNPKLHDKDIEQRIAGALNLSTEELCKKIKKNHLSVEDFLRAFFRVVAPYCAMMSDLLAMFEEANVTRTNESLEIAFDFGKGFDELKFDINHFRDQISRWKTIFVKYTTNFWGTKSLWELSSILRPSRMDYERKIMVPWFERYRDEKWPATLPEAPQSGIPYVDSVVSEVWSVVNDIHKASYEFARSRKEICDMVWGQMRVENRKTKDGSWDLNLLAGLASDYWLPNLVQGLHDKVDDVALMGNHALRWVNEINALLRRLPKATLSQPADVQELEDFLNLPIWKKRHELYAAWVSTQILEALSRPDAKIHHYNGRLDNGRLEFKVSGTHLVTFMETTPTLHLWSELRSPLNSPIGRSRTSSIQPDYSLTTEPRAVPESSILAVECKQYLKASAKNFSEALIDYANGRPNADIILVNHGPAPESILGRVPDDLRNRMWLIGDMKPGSEVSLEKFRRVVIRAFNKHFASTVQSASTLTLGDEESKKMVSSLSEIALHWNDRVKDLDLHLQIVTSNYDMVNVDYRSPGDIQNCPFAFLRSDVRKADGPEVIDIAKTIGKKYCISVHNFSSEASLFDSQAKIVVKSSIGLIEIDCPKDGSGTWWRVMVYDVENDAFQIVNKIGNGPFFRS